ncbi:MAG TPA: amidohydrolase [Longimicrobiales bacterium]|nr:amidohydrolase [Longimicrobiales bacterium]
MDNVTAEVEANRKLAQVMVDKIFSFGELGFFETETSKYLVSILKQNGFRVQEGMSGIPTAWHAEWGSGKPVIALGSDIDALPQANQKPGVAFRSPIVEGAPGHGEGHNSGQPLNIVAAIALKKVMERENIPGTIVLWPGVAEELGAAKAWFVRDGLFKNVDAVLFSHVDDHFDIAWGRAAGTGMVSVEFQFTGETSHAAGTPWMGRSALDAVELMNIAWNYRREHLRPEQRSHYVISDGGDQPNVVPNHAASWYYIREMDYPNIKANFETAIRIAEAAAKMTDTSMKYRILGASWPRYFNKPLAEVLHKHVEAVGNPQWSEADLQLARAVQRMLQTDTVGLSNSIDSIRPPLPKPESGGSDDIGDVAWVVPTAMLRYPANIPNVTRHHWSSAIAMATPIAHKGVVAGAKVLARTTLELMLDPSKISAAWSFFRDVQTKDVKYTPLITANDPPPLWLNRRTMDEYRPQMRRFYYDETKFDTYLQQLGIKYPTLQQ